jgi:NAD(P) transhydrogenase subunit alpha
MRIAVPREIAPYETRVALVPETAGRLVKSGLEVVVEAGAGSAASFTDAAYQEAGVRISTDTRALWAEADVVLKVREPMPHPTLGAHEADLLREGGALIGFLRPRRNTDLVARLTQRRVTGFSMDTIPRISRAQKMDALSSMSTIAGYKAALLAADTLGKFFPLFMTAAGTLAPARVFVLGAGVAGLQAIATSRRLGAVVEAFDVRPAVKEEVQSLGATFVNATLADASAQDAGGYAKELSEDFHQRERELLHAHVKTSDVVITTAMIPDKPAPKLITEAMVKDMRPGSVIVDLAAETGGNCELTKARERVVAHGVIIFGPVDLVCEMPVHASQMYSRNISTLLQHLVKDGKLNFDFSDEITRGTCVNPPADASAPPVAAPAIPAPALSAPAVSKAS